MTDDVAVFDPDLFAEAEATYRLLIKERKEREEREATERRAERMRRHARRVEEIIGPVVEDLGVGWAVVYAAHTWLRLKRLAAEVRAEDDGRGEPFVAFDEHAEAWWSWLSGVCEAMR